MRKWIPQATAFAWLSGRSYEEADFVVIAAGARNACARDAAAHAATWK